MRRLQDIKKIVIDRAERRGPEIERDALHDAQRRDGGDHRIDADERHEDAIDDADDHTDEKTERRAERDQARTDLVRNQEGRDDDGQAHHRTDRNVEPAHHQHVELGDGDQRERRRREQDMPDVEPGQKDVGLHRRIGAHGERQQAQQYERKPPLIAGAGDDLAKGLQRWPL